MINKPYKFIDIHSHVLSQADDGADSIEESLEMLRIAEKAGITDIIVTPHFKMGRHNVTYAGMMKRLEKLKKLSAQNGIGINLYPGNEIFYYGTLCDRLGMDGESMQDTPVSLNNSDRVLIEFAPKEDYNYIRNALYEIYNNGWIPVLAHVERYECMRKNKDNVQNLVSMGVEIQVNASAISGAQGFRMKRWVQEILREGLVTYVGTDAHDMKRRTPEIAGAMKLLYKKYEKEYVEDITYNNAARLLEERF